MNHHRSPRPPAPRRAGPAFVRCVALAAAAAVLAGADRPPAQAAELPAPADVAAVACRPRTEDYSFLVWAYGPPLACRGVRDGLPASLDTPDLLCVQTGTYGLAIDTQRVRLVRLGRLGRAAPASVAVAEGRDVVLALPRAGLELAVVVGPTTYTCAGRAPDPKDASQYPVRLIESGTFVQRADVLGLRFEDAVGNRLEADGRLEVVAWPDRVAFLLEVTPRRPLAAAALSIRVSGAGREVSTAVGAGVWPAGEARRCTAVWSPRKTDDGPVEVTVTGAETGDPVAVRLDADRGWHYVDLPPPRWTNRSGTYYPVEHLDQLDRYAVRVANPTDTEQVVRLLLAMDRGHPAITGFTPMLRDPAGVPTGIPVQLSKNWHRREEQRALYDGAWFHGFTMLRLPAHSATRLEFALTYARWGGVPAASHAQLCLVGWGHHQRWDQAAIGSFGESICYEPDGAQRRCMIDDVRPLLVWQMNAERRQWGWTNNVGGGDFLLYLDRNGTYQHLANVKALYTSHGPNLTDVTYAGTTADGCLAARLTVSTPPTDDLNRAFHRFRYDVLRPTRPKRLAFYQLGADHYLWFQYGKIARGNAEGLVEEWAPKTGGSAYGRTAIPCPGDAPWFSLHETVSRDTKGGAWANRGLVVRQWKARLGGRDVPHPFASVYGTQSGIASAALELGLPPDVEELRPGDFVEAEVELVIVPLAADDYYGPNANLRAALRAGADTWRPIHREAVGNHLAVRATRGRVRRRYPLALHVAGGQDAAFEVTGGLGYVPVTFTGLRNYTGYTLERREGEAWQPVDQAVHGNDFWQTDHDPATGTWRMTYNLPLDAPGDRPQTVGFRFRRTEAPAAPPAAPR